MKRKETSPCSMPLFYEMEEDRELVTRTETLRFVYLNAGYITNGVGTVLTFRDGKMTVKRYALNEEESAEPWTYDLLFPSGDGSALPPRFR